jgi:hypothetical protein
MAKSTFSSSRRGLMISGAGVAVGILARSASKPFPVLPGRSVPMPAPLRASIPAVPHGTDALDLVVNPLLLSKARAALDTHAGRFRARDRIAIVDFAAPSSDARLHFLDLVGGKASRLLVAHGSGSDPGHTGFLTRFSNAFDSNASSEGAFLVDDYYVGKHGRSQRLVGMDPTNNNALDRAIVIHGAWYANDEMIAAHGKLGRSQGCFAVGEHKLDDVFGFLGQGRMIFAART